jgi:hypothetical protein
MFEHMNDEYLKEHALRIRALADKADPFIKKRLLDLADGYDRKLGKPSRATSVLRSLVAINPPRSNPDT